MRLSTSTKASNPAEHISETVSTIDAAQYIIACLDDDAYIAEEQLHQLLFVAQTTLCRDWGRMFTPDEFINTGGFAQATPLAKILETIDPETLSNSDSELRFNNASYIGGSVAHLGTAECQWLNHILDLHLNSAPAWKLAEICAQSPVLNRVGYGEVVEFFPMG